MNITLNKSAPEGNVFTFHDLMFKAIKATGLQRARYFLRLVTIFPYACLQTDFQRRIWLTGKRRVLEHYKDLEQLALQDKI